MKISFLLIILLIFLILVDVQSIGTASSPTKRIQQRKGKKNRDSGAKRSKYHAPKRKKRSQTQSSGLKQKEKKMKKVKANSLITPLLNMNSEQSTLSQQEEVSISAIHDQVVAAMGLDNIVASTFILSLPTGHRKIDEILTAGYMLRAHKRDEEADLIFTALLRVRGDIQSALLSMAHAMVSRDPDRAAQYISTFMSLNPVHPAGHLILSKMSIN